MGDGEGGGGEWGGGGGGGSRSACMCIVHVCWKDSSETSDVYCLTRQETLTYFTLIPLVEKAPQDVPFDLLEAEMTPDSRIFQTVLSNVCV